MIVDEVAGGMQFSQTLVGQPRRLVLLLDGTWNKREDTTNVWRMRTMLGHGADQLVYYDEGVGTAKGEAISGGAFGTGLSGKVLGAYLWLMEHFEQADESPTGCDDEIFVFGFSRGAFTARSLVGLLAISGLLRRDAPQRVVDAFELSRLEGLAENSQISVDFRKNYSRAVRVRFLGVWDTVGALGVPKIKGIPQFKLGILEDNARHKVLRLPSIVDYARHAMALDEHRYVFDATLWPSALPGQSMEQRWFIGAHANVGGGYGRDGLFRRPLQWLQEEAAIVGLKFRQVVSRLGDSFYSSDPRDPLDEVFYGSYKLTQWMRPHHRLVSLGDASVQSIDYTVLERWSWNPSYRPVALHQLLPRKPSRRPFGCSMSNEEIINTLSIDGAVVTYSRGFTYL